RALGGDGASVQLDQMANEGEPDTEAALVPSAPALALLEAVEDERQQLAADAGAGVADHDLGVRVDALEGELDPAVSRRELHGVHQKIPDDLLQAIRIAVERSGVRIGEGLEPESLGVGRRSHRIEPPFQPPR